MKIYINDNINIIDQYINKEEFLAQINTIKPLEHIQIANDYGGHLIFSRGHKKLFNASYSDHGKPEYYVSTKEFTPKETLDIILRYLKNSSYWNDGTEFEIDHYQTEKNKRFLKHIETTTAQHDISHNAPLPYNGKTGLNQNLISDQETQRTYSAGEWRFALGLFIFGAFSLFIYHFNYGSGSANGQQRIEEARRKSDQQELEFRIADRRLEESRKAGAAALAAADDAIRSEASDRRQRLEKASRSVKTTNRNGIRVDQFILKKGGIVSCTTTISGNSPAIFNCDGDV